MFDFDFAIFCYLYKLIRLERLILIVFLYFWSKMVHSMIYFQKVHHASVISLISWDY